MFDLQSSILEFYECTYWYPFQLQLGSPLFRLQITCVLLYTLKWRIVHKNCVLMFWRSMHSHLSVIKQLHKIFIYDFWFLDDWYIIVCLHWGKKLLAFLWSSGVQWLRGSFVYRNSGTSFVFGLVLVCLPFYFVPFTVPYDQNEHWPPVEDRLFTV